MVRSQLPAQVINLFLEVRNFLSQNCNISLVLSIFKYNSGETNDIFITSR